MAVVIVVVGVVICALLAIGGHLIAAGVFAVMCIIGVSECHHSN